MKSRRRLFLCPRRGARALSPPVASFRRLRAPPLHVTFPIMLPSKGQESGMRHLSDQELMRIVQAGDYAPASELYDRYSGRIYNFAFRFLKNAEAAEDAVQEVFVKMLRHANQFHGDAKLSTWLFSITANWCRDYLRKSDNKPKEAEDVLVTIPT